MIFGLAVAALMLAEPGEPSRAPSALALMGYRVHLIVSEDLDPDGLKSLARPGVVLWMRTRTNMLRSSIVEALARFEEAYVQLRPPVLAAHASQLQRAGQVGIWVQDLDLVGEGLYRVGPRRLAVHVAGELTVERAERIRRARPTLVHWEPSEQVGLEAWSSFAQLPGSKLADLSAVAPEGNGLQVCESWPRGALRGVGLRRDLSRAWSEPPALPSCPGRVRIRVSPSLPDAALSRIYAANPATELELEIRDQSTLRAARSLLERLDASSPSARARRGP